MSTERIPILMYHRLGEAHNDWERKYCVSPQRFAEHMQTLAKKGWKTVSIDDFFSWLDGRIELPQYSFCLLLTMVFSGCMSTRHLRLKL